MKRLLITLASMMCLASFANADNIDKIVQDAIKHGARGKTYTQMRSMVELGCHYDVKHNDWTTEPDDKLPANFENPQGLPKWIYLEGSGTVRVFDGNGEIHFMHYVSERIRKVNGVRQAQVQLINGRWIDLE